MQLSILAAKILSLVYVCSGIAALTGKISFSKIAEDFERSPGLTFISGFMTLVIGMLLVEYHNVWVRNWTVLITIVGWMAVLKGIMLIVFPKSILSFKGIYKDTRIWGAFMIILGIVFGYFGFMM